MERMVLEVHGIPDIQRAHMSDQLTIHFLRLSNSGDVLAVIYPTSTKGQAYIIFESKNVPGVLQCSHVLEVDGAFYPIQVRKAQQSEVDMTVETTLDLSMFSNPQEAYRLAHLYPFEIRKLDRKRLDLKGSLLDLKLLRRQLTQLLAQDLQVQSRSPPALSNGYSSASSSNRRPESLEPRSLPVPSSSPVQSIANGVHARSRMPVIDGGSLSSLNLQQPVSPVYVRPGSGESRGRASPSMRRETSFLVEKDILDYILVYKQDIIKDIQAAYGAEISLVDNGVISRVKISGRHCEEAQAKLQAVTEELGSQLRTQEIHLYKYSPKQQRQIKDRIPLYKDNGVLIKQSDDIVKLVGSSSQSFLVMQRLLGNNDDPSAASTRQGRDLERSSKLRRSSSLPRSYKVNRDGAADRGRSPEPGYEAAAAGQDYQEAARRTPQVAQEHRRSESKQTSRERSSSESRTKNRENRPQPRDELALVPTAAEKSSKKFPNIKALLSPNPKITTEVFNKMKLRRKK